MRQLSKRRRLLLLWLGLSLVAVAALSWLTLVTGAFKDPIDANRNGAGLTSVLSRAVDPEMVRFQFREVRAAAGIDFQHFPATRQSLLPEDMGSGAAWGDFDNDGDPDLFLVNFKGALGAVDAPQDRRARSALYRNNGNGQFSDVTRDAGLIHFAYGLGAAWGDFDNDDDLDLYLSNYGPNCLYRNNGDGTFTDLTLRAGVGDNRFSTGSSWADFDNDGWIDLYVPNYVAFDSNAGDADTNTKQYGSELPFTINPSSYQPQANALYHNNGDGTFTDVALAAGVANPDGRSLGAAWFDFDDDGRVDLYVANDVSSNGVFRNLGHGRFVDIGANSLAADYRGAMGLAVADYDTDGDLDLFVTHWIAQENAFYENMFSENWKNDEGQRRLFFMDSADVVGLGQGSLNLVGWATGMADFDNDGLLDLWVVNGHTLQQPQDPTLLVPQVMQIYRQHADQGFFEIGQQANSAMAEPFVGRGGAQADYDGDGWMDILMMAHGGQPRLLRNQAAGQNHWLTLRLRQSGGNTRALGARLSVTTGKYTQSAQVGTQGSYLSQHQSDIHFGLGKSKKVDQLLVRWPDGESETLFNLEADQLLELNHAANY